MKHSVHLTEAASPLQTKLLALRPQLAAAAQKVYDEWDQSDEENGDVEYGHGGICDAISRAMSDVINLPDVDITDGGHDGDDHAYLIAYTATEAFAVDIPPSVYERGGGYSWKKIPDVTFRPDHIVIEPVPVPDDGEWG